MKHILVMIFIFFTASCANQKKTMLSPSRDTKTGATSAPNSGPKVVPKAEMQLDYKYFKVSYNEDHKLPNWVSYKLRASGHKSGLVKRKNNYFSDMALIKMQVPYAKPLDFVDDMYVRGHMAPAEDFVWNQAAYDATFVMTNITPQKKNFHKGAWKSLEAKVRAWSCTEGELKVISGPILTKSLKTFTSNVSIPRHYFKVVIDESPPKKAIAFILDQEAKTFDKTKMAVSLAEAEKLTGIHFGAESGFNKSEYLRLRRIATPSDWIESKCPR